MPVSQKKYDLKWCQGYAQSRGGVCLSTEFKGVHSALEYRCAEGHVWHTRPSKHIYEKSWCPVCLSGKPLPEAEVREFIESHGYILVGEFKGSTKKMVLECPEGHQWACTLINFKNTKHGCPDCSQVANEYSRTKTRKYSASDLLDRVAKRLGVCLSLQDVPADTLIAVADRGLFRCADGHEWETSFATIIRGHWCPRCAFGKKKSES
jgi:hypothetical protein